jgi:hypothetical protein
MQKKYKGFYIYYENILVKVIFKNRGINYEELKKN